MRRRMYCTEGRVQLFFRMETTSQVRHDVLKGHRDPNSAPLHKQQVHRPQSTHANRLSATENYREPIVTKIMFCLRGATRSLGPAAPQHQSSSSRANDDVARYLLMLSYTTT